MSAIRRKALGESMPGRGSEATLSRYERGLRALNLEMLKRVAKALGVSIGSLLDDGKPGGGSVTDEDELLTAYRTLSQRQRPTARWLVRRLREVK